jgi:hypothetical protein
LDVTFTPARLTPFPSKMYSLAWHSDLEIATPTSPCLMRTLRLPSCGLRTIVA